MFESLTVRNVYVLEVTEDELCYCEICCCKFMVISRFYNIFNRSFEVHVVGSVILLLDCPLQYPHFPYRIELAFLYIAFHKVSFFILICHLFYMYYSVQKLSDLWPGKQSSASGWLRYLIPFKVGPLWLHTLSPAVLPSLEAVLVGLFWNGVQLCRRVLYGVLAAVKTGVS
jgi:hypothetical protein